MKMAKNRKAVDKCPSCGRFRSSSVKDIGGAKYRCKTCDNCGTITVSFLVPVDGERCIATTSMP